MPNTSNERQLAEAVERCAAELEFATGCFQRLAAAASDAGLAVARWNEVVNAKDQREGHPDARRG